MTRLFRMDESGSLNEVETTDRLAGIYDAILIAENSGDGNYIYDYQNGQYQELVVSSGKTQQFANDAIKYGTPAADYDKVQLADEVSGSLSRVGGVIFPDDGVVGRPRDTGPAVEEF